MGRIQRRHQPGNPLPQPPMVPVLDPPSHHSVGRVLQHRLDLARPSRHHRPLHLHRPLHHRAAHRARHRAHHGLPHHLTHRFFRAARPPGRPVHVAPRQRGAQLVGTLPVGLRAIPAWPTPPRVGHLPPTPLTRPGHQHPHRPPSLPTQPVPVGPLCSPPRHEHTIPFRH